MAIVVYRIGSHIPVPGIDPERLQLLFSQNQGGILDLVNMFGGGALERMSIFALGIMPYISSSIITQLLVATTPSFNNCAKKVRPVGKNLSIHKIRHACAGACSRDGDEQRTCFSRTVLYQLAYVHFVAVTTLSQARCSSCGWVSRSPSVV